MDLHESPAEKRARRLSTKADPRMAMSEAEPSQLANDHSSSLQPLRLMQHKDMNGNLICKFHCLSKYREKYREKSFANILISRPRPL